jgi:hypothetical protein
MKKKENTGNVFWWGKNTPCFSGFFHTTVKNKNLMLKAGKIAPTTFPVLGKKIKT